MESFSSSTGNLKNVKRKISNGILEQPLGSVTDLETGRLNAEVPDTESYEHVQFEDDIYIKEENFDENEIDATAYLEVNLDEVNNDGDEFSQNDERDENVYHNRNISSGVHFMCSETSSSEYAPIRRKKQIFTMAKPIEVKPTSFTNTTIKFPITFDNKLKSFANLRLPIILLRQKKPDVIPVESSNIPTPIIAQNIQLLKNDAVPSRKMYHCDHCNYSTYQKSHFTQHMLSVHLKIKRYKCPKCDYRSARKSNLSQHVNSIHLKIKKFKCEHCNYCSAYKNNVTNHSNSAHSDIKRFTCLYCDFRTVYKENLVRHVRSIHMSNKAGFKCSYCDHGYKRKRDLIRHNKFAHAKLKKFKCKYCNFDTAYKNYLSTHIISNHSNIEKEFAQELCNVTAVQQSSLTKQITAVNLKINKFKCKYCDFHTTDKNLLAPHISSNHSNSKKQFKCEYCGLICVRQSMLTAHINNVHFKIKKFKCKYCDFSTAYKNSLNTHIISNHSSI